MADDDTEFFINGSTTTSIPSITTPSTTNNPTRSTPSRPPPVLEYAWDYIGSSLAPPLCWAITICVLTALLLCYRYRPCSLCIPPERGLSPTILILFSTHLIHSTAFALSASFVNHAVAYDPRTVNASGWLNTWWSFWAGNYQVVVPACVLAVTLDRFLALKLAYNYGKEVQKAFTKTTLGVVLGLGGFALVNVLVAWPYSDCEWGWVGVRVEVFKWMEVRDGIGKIVSDWLVEVLVDGPVPSTK